MQDQTPPAHRFYEEIRHSIDTVGQRLIGVGDKPPFVYTIGLAEKSLPELLVIGSLEAAVVLNFLSNKLRERDCKFANGEIIDIGGILPVMILNANSNAKKYYTVQATVFHLHDNYDVQQVVIPDLKGRFPDELKCAKPYRDIPVLGSRW